MTVHVGLVGAGAMGEAHLQTLSREIAGARVVAITDPDTRRASALVEQLGLAEVEIIDDPHHLVRLPQVEAVLIASPDETHHDLVMTCLDAATPVLCEKPLATTTEGCRHVVDREVEGGRRLIQLGYMRRFDPGYVAMKDALDAGRVGCCTGAALPAPQRHRAAVVHPGNAAAELRGPRDRCSPVAARDGHHSRIRVHPAPHAACSNRDARPHSDYARDNLGGGGRHRGVRQRPLRLRRPIRACRRGRHPVPDTAVPRRHPRAGNGAHPIHDDFRQRFADAYRQQLQHWIASIRDGIPTGASAWDGYTASQTAQACVSAATTGQAVDLSPTTSPPLYARA